MAAPLLIRYTSLRKCFCLRNSSVSVINTRQQTNTRNDTVRNESETEESDEKIFDVRDVSGLRPDLKARLPQHETIERKYSYIHFMPRKDEKKFRRQMFTKYGFKSGIDPTELWPTEEEIKIRIENDKILDPPLEQLMAELTAKKVAEEEHLRKREEKIVKNMAKMDNLMEGHMKKHKDKELALEKQEERKKYLQDRIYEHFGYQLHLKHPKALQFIEEFKEKERKMKRDQKKQDRKEKGAQKLKYMLQTKGVSGKVDEGEVDKNKETKGNIEETDQTDGNVDEVEK